MDIYTLADIWLEIRKNYVRSSTHQNYSYAVKRFKKFFANKEISLLTKVEVMETFAIMAKSGCSASAIYNVRQIMAAVYSFAIEEQLTTINPFKKIRIPPYAKEKKVEAYTLMEQNELMKATKEVLLGDYYVFLLSTGLRKGEFINLKWDNYDMDNHTITIDTSKTINGLRTIALSDTAEDIILKQKRYNHPYIFSTTQELPVSVSSLKKLCKRLTKKVGFNVTCHKARHTFCTRMIIDAQVDAKTVCLLSGHKSVYFLMQRYVSTDYSKQKQALSAIDNMFAR